MTIIAIDPNTHPFEANGNKLAVVAKDNQLDPNSAQDLIRLFSPMMETATRLADEAELIKVPDATHVKEIKRARDMRLKLREVRIAVEKARKSAKEDSLRKGRAIDGMANVFKFLIEPVEERMLALEEIAVRAESARKEALRQTREAQIRPYGVDVTLYQFGEMTEEAFGDFLESQRLLKESRDAAAKKAAEATAEAERQRLARQKELEEENHRLQVAAAAQAELHRQENELREAQAARERQKTAAALAQANAAAAEVKRQADAALEAERKKVAEMEEAERKRKAAADAQALAEKKAAAKAAKAPDREKLWQLSRKLEAIEMPTLSTDEGKQAGIAVQKYLTTFISQIQILAEKL